MQEPAFITIPLQTLEDLLHEVQGLKDQIKVLEDRQTEDNSNLHREIALDRQRISRLEYHEPEPRQINQGEVLRALLAANNGKMLQSTAREKMRLSAVEFSKLLGTMKNEIHIKNYYKDKRKNLLELVSGK